MLKMIVFVIVALSVLTEGAVAQGYTITSSCCTVTSSCCTVVSAGTNYISGTSCCATVVPDEATLAAWAARKAVEIQLNWFDKDKVKKLERDDIDALQIRVDAICKWAKTLSNHISVRAYAEWGADATSKLEERRQSLDKLDVAKSLVVGLPVPPEK
jgi:hypothetical protein